MNNKALNFMAGIIVLNFFWGSLYSFNQEKLFQTEEIKLETGRGFYNYFPLPVEIKYDPESIFILDADDHDIKIFSKSGGYQAKIGRKGRGPGEFDMPSGMDLFNEKLYVADKMNRRIQVLDKKGKYINGFKTKFSPEDIVVLKSDRIVVSYLPLIEKTEAQMIACFNQQGELLWRKFDSYDSGDRIYDVFRNRLDIEITKNGELVVAKKNNDRNIYFFDTEGILFHKIRVSDQYSSKDIVIPVGKKRKISNLYSEFVLSDDRFYLLSSQYINKGKNKDLVPGNEIHIFDIKGNKIGMIELPDRFKLISIDGQKIYGIDSDNRLRILKINQK